MGFLWIVLIGFVAGIIARLLSSAPNKPTGFILTTVLGIAGAFLATFIGQAVGWYARGYYYEARNRCLLVETGLRDSEVRC